MAGVDGIDEMAVEVGIAPKIAWQLQIFAGIVTVVLGAILVVHPTFSIGAVLALVGIALIIGGIFHFIRALDRDEVHRGWIGVVGLVEVVVGVIVIRHLFSDTAFALIGLLIGIAWVVQGVAALMAGILGTAGRSRAWPIIFGVISIAAGCVVISMPAHSVKVLAILLGIWFLVMGVLQLLGGFFLRSDLKKAGL